jgi:hypothetical protein
VYLNINGVRHTVTRRIVTSDTIKYVGVSPEPSAITGIIRMYRNDGFLMSSDDTSKFSRKLCSGSLVQLTNKAAPKIDPFVPAPTPPTAKVVTAVVG